MNLHRAEFVGLAAVLLVGAATIATAALLWLRARARARRDARARYLELDPRQRRRSS